MVTLPHTQPLLPLRFPRKRLEVKTTDSRGLDRHLRPAAHLRTRSVANRGPQSLLQFPQNVRGSPSSSPTGSSKFAKVGQHSRQTTTPALMHSSIRDGYLNNSGVSLPENRPSPRLASQLPAWPARPHHLSKARPAACTLLDANQQPLRGKWVSVLNTGGGQGRAGQDSLPPAFRDPKCMWPWGKSLHLSVALLSLVLVVPS